MRRPITSSRACVDRDLRDSDSLTRKRHHITFHGQKRARAVLKQPKPIISPDPQTGPATSKRPVSVPLLPTARLGADNPV